MIQSDRKRILACRVIYQIREGDQVGEAHDALFSLSGLTPAVVSDQLESEKSHQVYDLYFPCKNCAFGGPAKPDPNQGD
jgi:hypothetical protein